LSFSNCHLSLVYQCFGRYGVEYKYKHRGLQKRFTINIVILFNQLPTFLPWDWLNGNILQTSMLCSAESLLTVQQVL